MSKRDLVALTFVMSKGNLRQEDEPIIYIYISEGRIEIPSYRKYPEELPA